MNAVTNPFSRVSVGIKNPDGYAFPTETRHLQGRGNIVSDYGTAAFAFLPNPVISMVDITRYKSTGGNTQAVVSAPAMTAYTGSTSVIGGCTPSALSGVLESFRMVAGGVKIRVQTPELSRTGNLICAPFIACEKTPGPNFLNAVNVSNGTGRQLFSTLLGDISSDIAGSPAILELPGAFQVSLADLGREDLVLPFKPVFNASQDFHNTNSTTQVSTTEFLSDFTDTVITSGISGYTSSDFTSVHSGYGFCGWLCYMDGVAVATNSAALSFEYVYHLEGTPVISSAASAVPVAGALPPPPVSAVDYMQTLRDIAAMPWEDFISIGTEAMSIGASILGASHGYRGTVSLR